MQIRVYGQQGCPIALRSNRLSSFDLEHVKVTWGRSLQTAQPEDRGLWASCSTCSPKRWWPGSRATWPEKPLEQGLKCKGTKVSWFKTSEFARWIKQEAQGPWRPAWLFFKIRQTTWKIKLAFPTDYHTFHKNWLKLDDKRESSYPLIITSEILRWMTPNWSQESELWKSHYICSF